MDLIPNIRKRTEYYNKSFWEGISLSNDSNDKALLRMALFELSMNQEFMPETSNKCILNDNKVSDYLEQLREIDSDLSDEVSELLDRTEYISMDRLITLLNISMDKFEKHIGNEPFAIITTGDKGYSSEEYMIQLLWPRLRQLNIQGIYHYQDYIPCSTVLWIDDVSYSGGNMSETVSRQADYTTIYIILAVMSDISLKILDFIEQRPITFHIYYGLSVPSFRDKDCLISQYFWHPCTLPPIYLDYKVASAQSTYRYIYMDGLIPEKQLSDEDILDFDPSVDSLPGNCIGPLMTVTPSRKVITVLQEYHQSL